MSIKPKFEIEMIDQETVSINIKLEMSAQFFLTLAGQVYQHFVGVPLDMRNKQAKLRNNNDSGD